MFHDTWSFIVELNLLLPVFFLRSSGPSRALKLGARGKEVDDFVDKLKSEGENIIMSGTGKKSSEASKSVPAPANTER